ncbi:MAG: hypothetical protein K9N06_02915 [Candidatus Cloacimonetes bacterium]|nr:hypothetical protein [Candidatus Cloacimonadota bacterium]
MHNSEALGENWSPVLLYVILPALHPWSDWEFGVCNSICEVDVQADELNLVMDKLIDGKSIQDNCKTCGSANAGGISEFGGWGSL